MRAYFLEIATTDYNTTASAVAGGADRIELCASIMEGGLTPSFGMVKKCRDAFALPIFAIIRPRSGDFLYTQEEFEIMLLDTALCKQIGCDGIVAGILLDDGKIDKDRMEKIVNRAYPLEVTFHRAFDRCLDPYEALEDIISLGCTRILTSGQKTTALEGKDLIAALVQLAAGRVSIMPGGGIRSESLKPLMQQTGAYEFHTSLKDATNTQMSYIHPSFSNSYESYWQPLIDPVAVRELKNMLK
ncbi:MAG: copper homeostasis protein CutC [Flavisolibacter sp.]